MNTKDSLKEYYVKLHDLYNNAVNMLTAINQSLSTTASEVTIDLLDTDDTISTVRIPSFLYLENKLEQLDSNFQALFKMPESGEAWFNKASTMYKLELVKSSSAPATPIFNTDNISAQFTDSWILKDMVSPKTFMRFRIDNIGDNITQMYMKKLVIFSKEIFNTLNRNSNINSYEEYKAALYNYSEGVDYEIYDSIIDMPIRSDEFISEFRIEEIPDLESGNPWNDYSIGEDGHQHLQYKVRLDTITYHNQEDTSISFNLKAGDMLCLANDYVVYKVKNVTESIDDEGEPENYIILQEYIGHVALQNFYENQNMVLELYNNNYNKYHYIDIPLEENPYICIFLGTIYNNIRSKLSNGVMINLNTTYMRDTDGNLILKNGKPQTYITYYNENCKNIGDLILGLSNTLYPQLSNYSPDMLNMAVNGPQLLSLINNAIEKTDIRVLRINKHLIDDANAQDVISLHERKSNINNDLLSIQNNIDQIYNQLVTTDFSQEITITQESLKGELNKYYQERIAKQQELIGVVNDINVLKGGVKGIAESKYRVRGIVNADEYELYIRNLISKNIFLVGMEVEYKYSSISSDTTQVTNINSSLFSDWIRQDSIDRQRHLDFDEDGGVKIVFENYDSNTNIIKWNQIDIPINQGENVNIRIRFKYNIGQPFINLYSPWSSEFPVTFPAEYEENRDISTILLQNDNDLTAAEFNKTLINDGYEEHIANKLIDGSHMFYHMPENIYSGFNTPENSLISLKDKLISMSTELDKYKALIESELNSKYKVYLEYDNTSIELSNSTNNEITVNDPQNNIDGSFIKKNMNLIIRNTGDIPINLYSIFPGNIDTPLMCSYDQFYMEYIKNYESVPLIIGNIQNLLSENRNDVILEGNIYLQTFGQWIYFRENNPWTSENYYECSSSILGTNNKSVITKNNKQLSLKKRMFANTNVETSLLWGTLTLNGDNETYEIPTYNEMIDNNYVTKVYPGGQVESTAKYTINDCIPIPNNSSIIYDNTTYDKYLLMYEHFGGSIDNKSTNVKYLTSDISISKFIDTFFVLKSSDKTAALSALNGAFLYPQLNNTNHLKCNKYGTNQYYRLDVAKNLSIPIKFEYYLDGINASSISKTIAFDIRTSILQNPDHYVLTVRANYDESGANYMIQNNVMSLNDTLTDIKVELNPGDSISERK